VRSTAKLAKSLREKARKAGGERGIVLTRAEWQIVKRNRSDLLRLPVFGLLVLVFGEWLPLFVIWLTPVVPEACRIPKQVHKTLVGLEKRRKERQRRLAIDAARLIQRDRQAGTAQASHSLEPPFTNLTPQAVDKLDLFSLLTVSSKLDAHSKIWDWLFLTPPKGVLKWGVKRKLGYLTRDDQLIARDGGWQGLGKHEVERACVERGIDVLVRSESDLRRELAKWYGGGKV
jgi:hypothetical protein